MLPSKPSGGEIVNIPVWWEMQVAKPSLSPSPGVVPKLAHSSTPKDLVLLGPWDFTGTIALNNSQKTSSTSLDLLQLNAAI
jgi:hypothetical protein